MEFLGKWIMTAYESIGKKVGTWESWAPAGCFSRCNPSSALFFLPAMVITIQSIAIIGEGGMGGSQRRLFLFLSSLALAKSSMDLILSGGN